MQRVRQRREYRNSGDAPHPQDADPSRVALFNDYAVLDRQNKTYVISSLVRLVHVGDHGCQENKRPVAYDDSKKESIKCFFQAHHKIGQNSFEVSTAKAFEFPFTDILMHVNLAVSDSGSTLDIPEEAHKEVQQTVKKVFEQRRSRRTITTTLGSLSSTAHDRFIGSDDGRVVVQVEPEQQTEGGLRRSTRRRHAIVYDS